MPAYSQAKYTKFHQRSCCYLFLLYQEEIKRKRYKAISSQLRETVFKSQGKEKCAKYRQTWFR